ncbi:tetratricopeptide repeat protein [Bremerella sp. T1]|uniref:tetratricopeptide repeat protein n=1 Tax=Bremerella sp. TYQ1 TaxID=3119568 RepID=UPI001CCF1EF6|nr:tetratricopeptide repeat protein [Bremerella volcania]UBM34218.1 tetratricopeptide repeat protein [Bremerella volcania]
MVGRFSLFVAAALVCGLLCFPLHAEDYAGQADLDKAVDLKLDAEGMDDLAQVAELCESALDKGLHEEDQVFAKQLLTSVRYQRAETMGKGIFEEAQQRKDWKDLRAKAVEEVDKGLKYDDTVGMLHFLKARLLLLPDGDRDQAEQSINKAIELLQGTGEPLSKALVVSLVFAEDKDAQVDVLTKAIEANPNNADAYRLRGLMYLEQEKFQEALADLKMVTEQLAPGDLTSLQAYAQTFAKLGEFDEAIKAVNQIVKTNPNSPIGYLLRAQFKVMAGNVNAAIEDLDQVLVLAPRSVPALLMRASMYIEREDYKAALQDVERALAADTGNMQALLIRATLYAQEGKFAEAIRDLEALQIRNSENATITLQLATLYQAAKRPRKAVEVYNQVLKLEPENVNAMRGKGDALLSYGKHAEAVETYLNALKIQEDEEGGILNNLAWVMATSTNDNVRDGEKALKYAVEACEATDYSQAHILSTLAAAHAEKGEFDEARKWSKKAVEVAGGDEAAAEIREHLKNELKAYEGNEAWREIQDTKEGGQTDTIAGPASEVAEKLKESKSDKPADQEKKDESDKPEMTEPAPDMAPVS